MTNVRPYTDEQVLSKVESLDTFDGWKKGKYDVWVRSNEDEFDRFDDKVYSYEVVNDGERPVFIMVCSGTTNAGAQGLKNFEKYGNTRCAILKADHMVYESHYYRKHQGKYYAYCQHKPWPYYEDSNHDEKSDTDGKLIEGKVIYANSHRAGTASTRIGGWSIACLVRNTRVQYNKWMAWMDKDKFINTAILDEWEV